MDKVPLLRLFLSSPMCPAPLSMPSLPAGVPLMCDDFTKSKEFSTFRLGLFGLDDPGGFGVDSLSEQSEN